MTFSHNCSFCFILVFMIKENDTITLVVNSLLFKYIIFYDSNEIKLRYTKNVGDIS